MKRMRTILAFTLCVVVTVGLLSGLGPVKVRQANAAGTDPVFDEDEFGICYSKVLLSQLGKGYPRQGVSTDNRGYHVGDISTATPYNPATILDDRFDCFGLVITGLMAMGYTGFVDSAGKSYPFDIVTGGHVFESVDGILYNHGTGDVITLFGRA